MLVRVTAVQKFARGSILLLVLVLYQYYHSAAVRTVSAPVSNPTTASSVRNLKC